MKSSRDPQKNKTTHSGLRLPGWKLVIYINRFTSLAIAA